ncbi:MAG: MBL fold metallo-hydrolase [Lachnospiraceae bacterium]|nr:MBL fold metallo-hydrolase [Lachnospiraceae bacterium]
MVHSFEEYVSDYHKRYRQFYAHPQEAYLAPFRIYGNLYYVGDRKACMHLIDTGEGLVLIDMGFPHTYPLLLDSIFRLGFDPKDVKTVILTHGHFDHVGALAQFRETYGCRIGISRIDHDYLKTREDYVLKALTEPVAPMFSVPEDFDYLFEDGDTFELGNLKIDLQIVPGHTPGVLGFFFDAVGPEGPMRCGLIGGVGLSSIHPWYMEHFDFPKDLPQQMLSKVLSLKEEHVDIHLGNHPGNNDTLEKREKMLETVRTLHVTDGDLPADRNPFIDPEAWPAFLDGLAARIEKVIAGEL